MYTSAGYGFFIEKSKGDLLSFHRIADPAAKRLFLVLLDDYSRVMTAESE